MTASYKVLLLTGVMLPGIAWGACPAPYDTGKLLDDLVMVETALRKGDAATAGTVAGQLEAGVGCLNEVLPFMVASRVYRAIGAGKLGSGDEARGVEWFLTSLEIDPTYEYGVEDLPAGSPIRLRFNELRGEAETEPISVSGSKLADAAGGTYYLDGSILGGARATEGRPHVFQWQHDGTVESWLIQANAFPPERLEAKVAVAPAPEPTGKKPKPAKPPKPTKPAPEPDPEPAVAAAPDPEPEPRPKPVKPAPEPDPEPAIAAAPDPDPEPEPRPKPAKPAPEPDPEPSAEPEPVATAPSPKPKPVKPAPSSGFYERQRPAEKTPLMIGGGVVIAGAGALYGLAWASRAQFNQSEYEDPNGDDKGITALQRRTNQLVLLSGVALGVGAAGLTWGIIVDAGGTPLPAVNVRF